MILVVMTTGSSKSQNGCFFLFVCFFRQMLGQISHSQPKCVHSQVWVYKVEDVYKFVHFCNLRWSLHNEVVSEVSIRQQLQHNHDLQCVFLVARYGCWLSTVVLLHA